MDENLVIRKDNDMIRNTTNSFSYEQNQLMCVLLSKYVPTVNNDCMDVTISIDELRQALGIPDENDSYLSICEAIDSFGRCSSIKFFETNKKGEWIYTWLPLFLEIRLSDTTAQFSWNDLIFEHLSHYKSQYTEYLVSDYLKLKSTYSQILYEQMKSYQNIANRPQVVFTIADLHRIMRTEDVKAYKNFDTFKEMCIVQAINDINSNTDICVEIEVVKDEKDKRKVVGIAFTISGNESL